MRLANFIKINTNYTRSINLERDSDGSNVRPYIPTSRAIQTLTRIADTINIKETPRSWTLIGPYGSGKSTFGLFLGQLLSKPGTAGSQHARNVLKSVNLSLAQKVDKALDGTQGYCCINLTGSPESLGKRLIKAMFTSAQAFLGSKRGPVPNIIKRLEATSQSEFITTSEIIELIAELQRSIHRARGAGVLIIFDELG
jgi:hypothetical protein